MNPASSGVVQSAQQGLGGAGQVAAGLIGYTADGKPVYGGNALPPGMGQYGPTSLIRQPTRCSRPRRDGSTSSDPEGRTNTA